MEDAQRRASGAILAGGRARRFGRDKRRAVIDGRPLLARAVSAVAAVATDVHVVVGDPDDVGWVRALLSADASVRVARQGRPAEVIVDARPGEGPVAAIETALEAAEHEIVLIVAGDHPYVTPAVLRLLADRLDATPRQSVVTLATGGAPPPLVAAYRRSARHAAAALLDRGERRVGQLLTTLDAEVLAPEVWHAVDTGGTSAIDVDTPEDLRAVAHRTGWSRRRP